MNEYEKYRSPNICWAPLEWSSDMNDYPMVSIPMKYGELIIFNDTIVHASPTNESNNDRTTYHALAVPQEANLIYAKKNSDGIDIIRVADDFWLNYTPGEEEPTSPIIKTVKFEKRIYSESDFKS